MKGDRAKSDKAKGNNRDLRLQIRILTFEL